MRVACDGPGFETLRWPLEQRSLRTSHRCVAICIGIPVRAHERASERERERERERARERETTTHDCNTGKSTITMVKLVHWGATLKKRTDFCCTFYRLSSALAQYRHTSEAGHVCPTAFGRPATSSMVSTQPSLNPGCVEMAVRDPNTSPSHRRK